MRNLNIWWTQSGHFSSVFKKKAGETCPLSPYQLGPWILLWILPQASPEQDTKIDGSGHETFFEKITESWNIKYLALFSSGLRKIWKNMKNLWNPPDPPTAYLIYAP